MIALIVLTLVAALASLVYLAVLGRILIGLRDMLMDDRNERP